MIVHEMAQGSEAWLHARLGLPTASEFHKIITPARGELSKQAGKYAHALIAEKLLGRPLLKAPGTPWAMARGTELEPFARADYAATFGGELRTVGLVTTDDGRLGASPDALVVGQRGALEIKCTLDDTHVGIWADGPGDDYRAQVQGQMAVAELEWVDLWAWHPNLKPVRIRTQRDQPYITKMGAALVEFLGIYERLLERAVAEEWFARESPVPAASFAALRAA